MNTSLVVSRLRGGEGWALPLDTVPPGGSEINTGPDKKLYK